MSIPIMASILPDWSPEAWFMFFGAAAGCIIWAIRSGFWLSSIKREVVEGRKDVNGIGEQLKDHIADDRRDFDRILCSLDESSKAVQEIALRQENHEGRITNLEGRRNTR